MAKKHDLSEKKNILSVARRCETEFGSRLQQQKQNWHTKWVMAPPFGIIIDKFLLLLLLQG
jgi:hypothetical protein